MPTSLADGEAMQLHAADAARMLKVLANENRLLLSELKKITV